MQRENLTTGERHEVLRVIAERAREGDGPGARRDGLRLALVIEGGGMRGTISAGMALALHEAGVTRVFDAVYGASAGAITGAWLLSSTPENLTGWAEPSYARAMIRPSNLWLRRPVVDVRHLIEYLYREVAPMDFDSVLANPVEFHPLATDAHSGLSTDLRPFLTGPVELRLALRASAALPFLAGPPVRLGGHTFYDAGLAESIPYRTALAQGATHVLVLRSRSAPMPSPAAGSRAPARPSLGARLITSTTLRSHPGALHEVFHSRSTRLSEDDALLAAYDRSGLPSGTPPVDTAPRSEPAVLSIRPAPESPRVGRLTRDGKTLKAALEAGRTAVRRLLP
ncbi:patatin family protein [Streptomyces calidiresistens]|uniref:Patatin family protein n=1 Tax=Streptomyces calidiresistens TaxID=1485586 RepID=A0A7W3T4U3_9ACTN|nr:patatin-like phospholipase family protein [Streptomyces calidiresistens]MBB0230696.1 patatin family protein [Streptomyces calidiresistens]